MLYSAFHTQSQMLGQVRAWSHAVDAGLKRMEAEETPATRSMAAVRVGRAVFAAADFAGVRLAAGPRARAGRTTAGRALERVVRGVAVREGMVHPSKERSWFIARNMPPVAR